MIPTVKSNHVQRRHNSERFEDAVGGMRGFVRAVYGSTDAARQDHTNDPLCRVANDSKLNLAIGDPRVHVAYDHTGYVGRYTSYEVISDAPKATATTSEPTIDVDVIVRRAIARGLTVVEYCSQIGLVA